MTPDNAGQTVLADLDKLIAAASCEDCGGTGWITVRTGVYGADQEPCDCTDAIITAGAALKKAGEDHLRPLLAALEGVNTEDPPPDEAWKAAEEALAAVGRDIAKALGE